jgi:hypothetical protein
MRLSCAAAHACRAFLLLSSLQGGALLGEGLLLLLPQLLEEQTTAANIAAAALSQNDKLLLQVLVPLQQSRHKEMVLAMLRLEQPWPRICVLRQRCLKGTK